METIVNKVAESGIISLDLASYMPDEALIVAFDLKPFLFREMILKEKDYREALKNLDWAVYQDKKVALYCSVDAIIPVWAYMLATVYLEPFAQMVFLGDKEALSTQLLLQALSDIDVVAYQDKRVVIKGCGEIKIPDEAYVKISALLRPYVKSLMYGEPCSTVPLYKKK